MEIDQQALDNLKNANTVGVLTGAGISAASGVPTFRGSQGLWQKFRPEDLASVDSFIRNPDLVWEWYNWRRKLILEVKPNAAHLALVELEKKIPDFTLITQNVDNLHQIAGSQNVIELHGNIMQNKCSQCNKPYHEELDLNGEVVRCESCNGMIRPDVVWFGEMLPQNAIQTTYQIAEKSDLFLSVGTSALVEPAASLPFIANNNGAYVIEFNTERTPVSAIADMMIQESVDSALPELVRKIVDKSF